MNRSIFDIETILDGAEILGWTPGMLQIGLQGRLILEVTEQNGFLRLNRPGITFQPSNMNAPCTEDDDVCLALLPFSQKLWQDTAEATLARTRCIMQAHTALIARYSDVALDALLREHTDAPLHLEGHTKIYPRTDTKSSVAYIYQPGIGGTHLTLQSPRLFQATRTLSCVDSQGIWRLQSDAGHEYALTIPDLSTRHARMEFLSSRKDAIDQVDRQILPLIVR